MSKKLSSLCALTASLWLAACAPTGNYARVENQLVAEPDPIALRLTTAVDKASTALQTLARVEQAKHPEFAVMTVPDAPIEMKRTVSLAWHGPIEPVVRRLAERSGFRFVSMGDKPPVPVIVAINATHKPIVEILRDVGLQAGTRADVVVDEERRVVEVSYAPITGG